MPISTGDSHERNNGYGDTPVTLSVVLEKYLTVRRVRSSTEDVYRRVLRNTLADWLEQPITSLTKDLIEERHRDLSRLTKYGTSGEAYANLAMRVLRALLNFAADNYEVNGQPIIAANPVGRLSRNKRWYRVQPRQTVIPDHKLSSWYQSVLSLQSSVVRDYLLLLLFTGLRRTEAAKLKWTDIDFEAHVLTVQPDNAKNHREHRLPITDFLNDLLSRRHADKGECEYVFPGRGNRGHLVEFRESILEVREKSGCKFTIHDIRRTFVTMAERLDVPYYALKKLVNHVSGGDVTAGYIVVDVERLRGQMARITNRLLGVITGQIMNTPSQTDDASNLYSLKHTPTAKGLLIEICFARDSA